eukprot:scaffold125981_cov28-Tisochrysis_lutea.AAC.1
MKRAFDDDCHVVQLSECPKQNRIFGGYSYATSRREYKCAAEGAEDCGASRRLPRDAECLQRSVSIRVSLLGPAIWPASARAHGGLCALELARCHLDSPREDQFAPSLRHRRIQWKGERRRVGRTSHWTEGTGVLLGSRAGAGGERRTDGARPRPP